VTTGSRRCGATDPTGGWGERCVRGTVTEQPRMLIVSPPSTTAKVKLNMLVVEMSQSTISTSLAAATVIAGTSKRGLLGAARCSGAI
jgi:hypothetical protein